MKVLIIGAGAVGSVIAKFFDLDKECSKIICADNNLERAKKFVNFPSKKISFVEVDAADSDQVASIAKNVDLVINAALPRFNTSILEACLKAGVHYQDLCSYLDSDNRPEQFGFDQKFKEKGLIGLINTGLSPGITNLLARDAADHFDEVDFVHIRTLQNQNAVQPIFALSPEIILEESTEPSLVFENGKFEYIPPFSAFDEFDFGYPAGKRFVFSVYGDEVSTLARSLKAKEVNFRACGNDIESAKALFDLGLLNKEPIQVGAESFIPLDFISKGLQDVPTPDEMVELVRKGVFKDSEVVVAVEVAGKKFGNSFKVRKSIRFPSIHEIHKVFPGATYISYPTGLCAYAFAKAILNSKERGVMASEGLAKELQTIVLVLIATQGLEIKEVILSI